LRLRLHDLGLGGRGLGPHLLDLGVGLDHLLLALAICASICSTFTCWSAGSSSAMHVARLDDAGCRPPARGDDAGDARRHRVHVAGDIGVFGFDEVMAAVPHAAAGDDAASAISATTTSTRLLGGVLPAAGAGGRGGRRIAERLLLDRGLRLGHEATPKKK
jgi:hypothetical protein